MCEGCVKLVGLVSMCRKLVVCCPPNIRKKFKGTIFVSPIKSSIISNMLVLGDVEVLHDPIWTLSGLCLPFSPLCSTVMFCGLPTHPLIA